MRLKPDPGRHTKRRYIHPDLGDDPQPDPHEFADKAWTAKVQRFLVRHYPLHRFCADIDSRNGVIKLYIPSLMGSINGFIVHMNLIVNENDFQTWMHRACGEILERYRIPRARFSEADLRAALRRSPIGLNNAPVPE